MPDKNGFDSIPRHGVTTLRCVWCPTALPAWTDEKVLERHSRKHVGDIADARAAGDAELKMMSQVLSEED